MMEYFEILENPLLLFSDELQVDRMMVNGICIGQPWDTNRNAEIEGGADRQGFFKYNHEEGLCYYNTKAGVSVEWLDLVQKKVWDTHYYMKWGCTFGVNENLVRGFRLSSDFIQSELQLDVDVFLSMTRDVSFLIQKRFWDKGELLHIDYQFPGSKLHVQLSSPRQGAIESIYFFPPRAIKPIEKSPFHPPAPPT